ncbi:MAG: hypothetical protein PHF56_00145 [Desulfuromonadaceae bacterium]|nr:hypothetical protein [Desulfuromonadaceae bacterium]
MTHGKNSSNVRPLHQLTGGRKWLIGVPNTMATRQWKIRFRSEALNTQNIPEHVRASGLYCPACGKGQVLSRRCVYCGCAFACYVIMETPAASGEKQQPGTSGSSASIKQGRSSRFFPLYKTTIDNFTALSLRIRVIAVCVLLLCAILAAIGIIQYQNSVQKQYTQNFILALYGIKSGMSMTGMICAGEYSAWKEGVPSETPVSGEIDSQATADLATVKAEVDALMAKTENPPSEYRQSALTLRKLYALYGTMNAEILSSPDFLSRCKADVAAAHEDFSREIENLKTQMPGALTEAFKKAGQKYDLRFMEL